MPLNCQCRVIPQKNYQRALWKNGLGHTDQIAIYPENADLKKGNFIWRLSSAKIDQGSAFSVFPDHDRVLVIIKGAGVGLSHTFEPGAEDYVEVMPFEPYEFPGDISSRCELLSGGVTDLSLFVRKGEIEPIVEVLEIESKSPSTWSPQGRTNFLYAATGAVKIGPDIQGQTFELNENDTFRVDRISGNLSLAITGKVTGAKLIAISL